MLRVLVVEDGTEYIDVLTRFLTEGFVFARAGSGVAALAAVGDATYDAIVMDLRFDRAPEAELLGDHDSLLDRFNGDPVQARRFREDQQGIYILAALREAGCSVPVLLSHDMGDEPRRWARLVEKYHPVAYLPDNAGPTDIGSALQALVNQ